MVAAAWVAGAAVVAALVGAMSADRPLLVAAACVGLVLLGLSSRPRAAMGLWLLVLVAVPYWLGTNDYAYLPPAAIVGAPLLIGLWGRARIRLSAADLFVVLFFVLATLVVFSGSGGIGSWAAMVVQWGLAYLIGRRLPPVAGLRWTADFFAWVMVAVAALAVIEYWFGWHPFVHLVGPNPAEAATWAPVQTRAGVARSEWAFGHSIILGGALAASIPFVVTVQRARRWRIPAVVVVVLGVLTTVSRGAIIGAAVTLLLCGYTLVRDLGPKIRAGLLVLLAAAAAVVVPLLIAAQDQEAVSSTGYRLSLFEQLLSGDLHAFSTAAGISPGQYGGDYRGFQSIDNAFFAVAITYGWVLALLMLGGVLAAVARSVARRATVPEVALAGQLPVLVTVALITQYQMVVWFLLGMGVTWAAQARARSELSDLDAHRPGVGASERQAAGSGQTSAV